MSIVALFLAAVLGQPAVSGPSIVVTGQRLAERKGALAACLARQCPPDEDIDATLALAESQLVAGNYQGARKTLLASLARNGGEAARYPIPLSDLYRANGRVAADLGLDGDYYRSTWGIYRTLKHGLPDDDVRHFSALMEVAEMSGRIRGHESARLYYRMIAHEARAAKRPDIAAIAELRSAIRHLPPGSSWQVATIERIAASRSPDMRAPALEAKLALARMAYQAGDEANAAAKLAELGALGIKRPVLIYSPPYRLGQENPGSDEADSGVRTGVTTVIVDQETGSIRRATTMEQKGPGAFATSRASPLVDDMWMDVAFRVTPEGKVADLKVVRSKGDTSWAKPMLHAIEGRRYTPGDPRSPTSRRVERYTFTSGLERKSGTRAARHSPDTRVEYMDLSEETGGLSEAN